VPRFQPRSHGVEYVERYSPRTSTQDTVRFSGSF
jgi:hypothetical protein